MFSMFRGSFYNSFSKIVLRYILKIIELELIGLGNLHKKHQIQIIHINHCTIEGETEKVSYRVDKKY